MRPLFLCLLFIGLFSCSSTVQRAPSSLDKLSASGACASRIRVFFAPKHKLVKSLDDFLRHTRLHVVRNRAMASELVARFPHTFDLVNEDLVQAFMKVHDQSKLNPNLTRDGRRFIGERLYEFYGLPDSLLSEAEKAERKKLISELNLVDSMAITEFFKRSELLDRKDNPNEVARQLIKIEKIVDFVDRGMANVSTEEFSRPMQKGSEFIEPELRRFALYLERNYKRITVGMEYSPANGVGNH